MHICPACHRHVREAACPFCGAHHGGAPKIDTKIRVGVQRAALVVAGALAMAATGTACNGDSNQDAAVDAAPTDTGVDAAVDADAASPDAADEDVVSVGDVYGVSG